MPIQGFTRLRKHQLGRQSAFGTKVAAKRAYPLAGPPSVGDGLNWTDPEVDSGSIYPVASPVRGAPNLTASPTFPALYYNDLPLILSAFFGGAETPTGAGTAKTWAYAPAAVAPLDEFDPFTYEFGDDVTSDWFQFGDAILTGFEITSPEGMGQLTASLTWLMGSFASSGSTDFPASPSVPTASLSVAIDDIPIYGHDGVIAIDSAFGDLGDNQILDATHSWTLRATQTIDQKRFANQSQSFDVDAYGRGPVELQFEAQFAKTSDTVGTGSESDAWESATAVNRYLKVSFESLSEAEAATPYTFDFSMPMRYYTRNEGNIGGNTTVTLIGHAFDDEADFGGAFAANVVNTLASTAF